MTLFEILEDAIQKGATDVHLAKGLPPTYRIKRNLIRQEEMQVLTETELVEMTDTLMNNQQDRL